MKNTFLYIIFVFGCFILGYLIHDSFFKISLSQLNVGRIQIIMPSISDMFYSKVFFSITLGLLPLLYLSIDEYIKLKTVQKLLAFSIIVFSGILFWQFKVFQLNQTFETIISLETQNENLNTFSFKNLNITLYVFLGFILGTLMTFIVFRSYKKRDDNSSSI